MGPSTYSFETNKENEVHDLLLGSGCRRYVFAEVFALPWFKVREKFVEEKFFSTSLVKVTVLYYNITTSM